MSNNKNNNKENSTSKKNQTLRKEKINSSFEKAVKANGDALKKLSKN
ncbi:hypothetical protein [Lysinibacillus sp. NPDC093692]